MAATARRTLAEDSFERVAAAPTAWPRLADHHDQAGPTSVGDQQQRLQAALAKQSAPAYLAMVKLALKIGAPVTLWAAVLLCAARVGQMVQP